jgi:hypothetical protein
VKEALPERDLFGARPHEYELPDSAYLTKCASCGAAMAFVKTPNGKAMPLSLATVETRDGIRYALPHFVDCPQAREWSKK